MRFSRGIHKAYADLAVSSWPCCHHHRPIHSGAHWAPAPESTYRWHRDRGGGAPSLPVFAVVDTGVDDAMALAYLLASADADLVGIASTAGNVPVQQVCRNNLGLLELCQITGVPVSKGSDQPVSAPLRTAEDTHGPEGLGYPGCLQPTCSSPPMTPPRPWCVPRTPTPASWWPSRLGH